MRKKGFTNFVQVKRELGFINPEGYRLIDRNLVFLRFHESHMLPVLNDAIRKMSECKISDVGYADMRETIIEEFFDGMPKVNSHNQELTSGIKIKLEHIFRTILNSIVPVGEHENYL